MNFNRQRQQFLPGCLIVLLLLGIWISAPLPTLAAQPAELPPAVARSVRQDLSQRINQPSAQVKVVEATAQQWSNGCLELARPDEFCTAAIVPGWRIVLSHGRQRWLYHTDNTGRTYRFAGHLPGAR
jgi:hypothetical protein